MKYNYNRAIDNPHSGCYNHHAFKLYQKGIDDMAEINMRQIEVFLCAAKHQNISRAAEELYISQPALSKTISKLEKEFGRPLFRRGNRGVQLTDEGRELYARLDFEYHRFRVSVEDIIRQQRRGKNELRIGSLNREVVWLMARENTHAYRLQHPDVQIALERYDSFSLRRKLLCDELDLILTRSSELMPAWEFGTLPICDYPLFFIVPQDAAELPLEALNGKPLILEAATQRRRAEEICGAYGIIPSCVRYAGSFSMLAALICREKGFSIDSKMVLSDAETASIAYLPVRRSFHGQVVLAWRAESVTPAAEDFAAFLDPGCAKAGAGIPADETE